ncbi:MAG: hypothetical protein IJ343_16045 [Clostridia bacterium]|nr:hypothetical protein [Clostridia bacterium]
MAKVKVEEQLVNAADEEQMTEQQNEPQTLMEQLMQMQKELAEKMAALEAREAAVSEKEQKVSGETGMAARTVKAPVTSNAWKEMRTTFLPRAHAGEENFVLVGVNGQQWKVPRGVPVEVPVPLHERLEIMLDQEEKAYKYRMELQEKAEETQRAIMRVR